ncbi:MAG TPA: type 4a pilus biogenesis protein PilO [Vicinamibacterales bacterium]|nr:type 4a pilus biogenesis protein PilO [Vicinamibacterales bacterium]
MSDAVRWPLARRILDEYRRFVIPLAVLLLANVLVYAFYVFPLSQRVSNVTERTQAAEGELNAARLQHSQASNMVTGRARSAEGLETFYNAVLPANPAAARQLASPRLDQLARQSNVHAKRISTEAVSERDRTLTRLEIRMDVTGTYDAIRRFVHQLERSRDFVVVQNLRISEGSNEDAQLNVQLELATFYKAVAP